MTALSIPALSVKQPWAWLIVHGHKPVENRDWPTRVRGWIAIHAGKSFDEEGYWWVRQTFPHIAVPTPALCDRGGIVGRVRLLDCVERFDSPWFAGRYGFVLADPVAVPLIACRGQLGFFRPDVALPSQR